MLGSSDTEDKYSSDEVVLVPSSSLDIEIVLDKEIVDSDNEQKLGAELNRKQVMVLLKTNLKMKVLTRKLKTRVKRKLKNWTLKVQNRKLNVTKKRRVSLNKNLNVNRIHRKLIKLKVQNRKLKTRVSLKKKLNVNRKLMKLKVQKRKLKTRVSLNKNLNVKNWKLKVQTRKLNVTKKRTS